MLSQPSTSPSTDSSFESLNQVLPFSEASPPFSKDNDEISDYCLKKDYDLQDLEELSKYLKSNDRLKQHHGAIAIRKIITEINAIQRIIDVDVIPRLVEFLQRNDEPLLQGEAGWILSDICYGHTQQIRKVVENGAIPIAIRLLASPVPRIVENTMYLLGNIAVDCLEFREQLFANGALPALVRVLKKAIKQKTNNFIALCVWALNGLSQKFLPADENIKNTIVVLCDVLQESGDLDVIDNSLSALHSFSTSIQIQIPRDFPRKTFAALVKYLSSSRSSIVLSALDILGDALVEEEDAINIVLKTPNLLKKLFELLEHEEQGVRRLSCWVMSNITAGQSDQLELVIGNENYVKKLLKVLESDDTLEVRKETAEVILNAVRGANEKQRMSMANKGVLGCMFKLAQQEEKDMRKFGSEGVEIYEECLKKVLDDVRNKENQM